MIKVSKQSKPVVVHTAPSVQAHSAEIHWCQPADGQHSPAAKAPRESNKTQKVERSKWSSTSQDLEQRKLYWAKRVMEYRGQAQFCKAEDQDQVQPDLMQAALARSRAVHPAINTPHSPLVQEELAEQAHVLTPSQETRRNRQPHARHSSKPSQDSNMAVENEPIFRRDGLSIERESPRWSSQGVHPTIGSEAQGPNPRPIEKSNDERSLLQAHAAQPTRETARTPLGLLDQLNGGAPVSNQAAVAVADDDDDDADDSSTSSYDHAVQKSAPRPSLWFGQNNFVGGPTHH